MNKIAVVDDSKDFLKKIAYKIMYAGKFKKLNIDKTFSDIGQEEKNKISHRAIAIKELIEKLKNKN